MKECEMQKRARLIRGEVLCLTLLLFAAFLFGCGKAVDTGGLSGTWILVDAGDDEIRLPGMMSGGLGLLIRLDPDGTGIIDNGTLSGRILWSYEQGTVTVKGGSQTLVGHPENGTLVLKEEGSDIELVFRGANMSEADSETDTLQKAELETADNKDAQVEFENEPEQERKESYAVGEWYGWWKIEDARGELPVTWYDCCAVFTNEPDGVIYMKLWDEDSSRNEPLAEIQFEAGEENELVSLNGYFLFSEIHRGDWSFIPEKSEIYLSDLIHDAGGEHFRYSIYLRPWGDRWKTTLAEQRPFYYDDWYLPLVKKKEAMPDRIPWEELEYARENPTD